MLTPRQNLIETISGGKPERYVNQYEPFKQFFTPFQARNPRPKYGQMNSVNLWGITSSWPVGTPGAFPVHTPDKLVIKDITHWRDYVHAPDVRSSDAEWEGILEAAAKIDRNEYFVTASVAPGIFEQCHHLGEIQNTLMNFYLEPECQHELIDYLTDWELKLAEEFCTHLKPDALFHHDDWGTQISTFISPDMFEEFLLPAYKKVYGYYKSHGVKCIVHHSDSYAATLVPYMIEMGIDVWQGVMSTNNIPQLIGEYGGKLTFMGGLDSAKVDFPGSCRENIAKEVDRVCAECGTRYFIPCATQGGPMSTYPGIYELVGEEIDRCSKTMFNA